MQIAKDEQKEQQRVPEHVIATYYNSMTNLINTYLCSFRKDKTTLPDPEIVHMIREVAMQNLKQCMDEVVAICMEPETK